MSAARKDAWIWVPLANIGEGLPYAIINVVLVAILADMQVDAGTAVFVASICALPWSLKALWSPVVEAYGTRRGWMKWMLTAFIVLLLCLSASLGGSIYIIGGIGLLAALVASTYDIACDGHYMRVLPPNEQAYFVGIRTTAYRIGMLIATGGMTAFCGWLITQGETVKFSWQFSLALAALLIAGIGLFNNGRWGNKGLLPQDKSENGRTLSGSYLSSVKTFFMSKGVKELCFIFAFLFLYRLGEALLSKVTILFLKDTTENGGLALNNEQYGLLYGTFGMIALIAGGILGGMAISKYGLGRCVLPMALTVNLPDLLYVWLAITQQSNLWLVGSCIAIEQFGYGFGLAAYTVYLLQCSKGEHETAHYAFLTAIMGLSLMLPSAISGFMLEQLSFVAFFWTATLATIPGIILSYILYKHLTK